MKLKRLHDDAGACTGVKIVHTGLDPEQTWDQGQVMQYASEGWMRLDGDSIFVSGSGETLQYEVLRKPGYFVASTGERIPVSELAMTQFMTERVATLAPAEARAFLAAKGLPANDYEASQHYRCRLNDAQHAKWRKVFDAAGNDVAAHTLEG
jgi:hypothetical protein